MPELGSLERLAAIHAASFDHPPPWNAAAIADVAATPGTFILTAGAGPDGFIMGRTILDEVELLTLAVDPACRRQGLGARLLADFAAHARAMGAVHAFLEVAADNEAAQCLYAGHGWQVAGRRRGYYQASDGRRIDATVMSMNLGSAHLT